MNGLGAIILVVLIIWGGYSLFSRDKISDDFSSDSYSEQYEVSGQESLNQKIPTTVGQGIMLAGNGENEVTIVAVILTPLLRDAKSMKRRWLIMKCV